MSSTQQDAAFGNAFLDDMIEYIGDNYDPEDIFDTDVLENWAEEHDYVKDN